MCRMLFPFSLLFCLALFVIPSLIQAQGQGQAVKLPNVDDLLRDWEKTSSGIRSLNVEFTRKEFDKFGKSVTNGGQALLRSPDLAVLLYYDPEDGAKEQERFVCTGQEIWRYVSEVKQIYIYRLKKDQADPPLNQGPMRFLFNMKATDLKGRYLVKVMEQNPKFRHAKDCDMIQIVPRNPQEREEFFKVYVWLRKDDHFPKAIRLMKDDRDERWEHFDFNKIKSNQTIKDTIFQGRKYSGWEIIDNSVGDDAGPVPGPAGKSKFAPVPGRLGTNPGQNSPKIR